MADKMYVAILGKAVIPQIIEALGLDPRQVYSIDLHFSVGSIATAEIGMYPGPEFEEIDWSLAVEENDG